MKHIFTASVLACFGLSPLVSRAQSEPSGGLAQTTPAGKAQALKLGFQASWNGGIYAGYERQIGAHSSLQGAVVYWQRTYRTSFSGVYRTREFAAELTYRRYLQAAKPALVGWYAAGGASFLGDVHSSETDSNFLHGQSLTLRFGRQCQLGQRFTFDFNLGPDVALGFRRKYVWDDNQRMYVQSTSKYFFHLTGLAVALHAGYRF
ncbi:DUF3575 domain-containing protein [Hymenobacter latericus]|uniref:DUF3575 domain-containing protein n=1 Tax=Hymenobacter sp. YIM 151858-1 TaxID=2987688 RepID=UPI002226F7F3|nr:DUF3575 domain-containing protein [Hymenobacter sp. YIM 151858-1]UYZ60232.1 DUF3575 domain-containing protein [Hymenobacter sp. YIM 151858-1]